MSTKFLDYPGNQGFSGIIKKFRFKYDWDLDAIYVNNFLLDLQLSQSNRKYQYVKIQRDILEKEINTVNKKNICFSYNNVGKLCKLVLDKLINYGKENIV